MNSAFVAKLRAAQASGTQWAIYIAPKLETLPPVIARHDDPFLPYTRAIFAATSDHLCAYVFDFAAYLALGAAGAIALERSIRIVGESHLTVLDGRFASEAYATVWDEGAFGVDALTVTTETILGAYTARDDRQAFVLSDDLSHDASFSPSQNRFRIEDLEIKLLPLDTLYRARSLNFEEKLRELTKGIIRD